MPQWLALRAPQGRFSVDKCRNRLERAFGRAAVTAEQQRRQNSDNGRTAVTAEQQ
jgi:hypothetical protein